MTLKDIARLANCATATGSRVINNEKGVSEETRAYIQRVIDENGYQPNTWSQDTYRLEKKLLAYCSERSVAPNRCHDFKAGKHHLIFTECIFQILIFDF